MLNIAIKQTDTWLNGGSYKHGGYGSYRNSYG